MEPSVCRFTPAEGGARLAATARVKNTLVTEHTSFIATRLLYEEAYQIRGSLSSGKKRSIYITLESRVEFVCYSLNIITDLVSVGITDVNEVQLQDIVEDNQVLVCTSAVAQALIEKVVLRMCHVNVIIIDSCHLIWHDPHLRYLMHIYKLTEESLRPRILGLTYPLFNLTKKTIIENQNEINKTDTINALNTKENIDDENETEVNKDETGINNDETKILNYEIETNINKNINKDVIAIKQDATEIEENETDIRKCKTEIKKVKTATDKDETATNNVDSGTTKAESATNGDETEIKKNKTEIKINESEIKEIESKIKKNETETIQNGIEIIEDETETIKNGIEIIEDETEILENEIRINKNEEIIKDGTEIQKIETATNKDEYASNKNETEINKDEAEILNNETAILDEKSKGDDVSNKSKEMAKNIRDNDRFVCGKYENLDDFDMYEKIEWKIDVLESELCCKADLAEDIDGVKRLSMAVAKPKELIIEYKEQRDAAALQKSHVELENYMRDTVKEVLDFFDEHRYDPTEIYGDDMYDEIKLIPDPTIEPKEILYQFLYILDQLGPYGADKAAFSLLAKLEKLKITIPYERHFLLLCVCTSVFVKIRAYADLVFSEYESEWDKIQNYCSPKILRFVEILEQFKPPNSDKNECDKNKNDSDTNDKETGERNERHKVSFKQDLINIIESCDFSKLGDKIEDTINTHESNLKELEYLNLAHNDTSKIYNKSVKIDTDKNENVKNENVNVKNETETVKNGNDTGTEQTKVLGYPRRLGYRSRIRGRVPRSVNRIQQLLLNPDALCGIVFVKEALMAKILFMIIVELSRHHPSLNFICSQYCGNERPADPVAEQKDYEKQRKKQEEVLKKFRMHECNLLIATSLLEEGIDLPRCNLVLRWDIPISYRSYGLCRSRARAVRSTCVVMTSQTGDMTSQTGDMTSATGHVTSPTDYMVHNLATYKELDQIVSRKCGCGAQEEPPQSEELDADVYTNIIEPYTPSEGLKIFENQCKMEHETNICNINTEYTINISNNKNSVNKDTIPKSNISVNELSVNLSETSVNTIPKSNISVSDLSVNLSETSVNKNDTSEILSETVASVDLSTAVALINRYCGKLPSDTFTRLSPQYWMEEVLLPLVDRPGATGKAYICTLRLPLNCPVKYNIVGHPMPTRVLARRMVALQACRILHKSGELDNQLMPIGKENFKAVESPDKFPMESEIARPGSTKRRQYYFKRTARAFTDCEPIVDSTDADIINNPIFDPSTQPTTGRRNMLFLLSSRLCCGLPERYNTRGRRLHQPQLAQQALAILMATDNKDALSIPSFPVYTRSGEVHVCVKHVNDADVRVSPNRGRLVRRFMRFVFAEVLRVRRRGMSLQSEGSTHNNYYIVPTIKSTRPDGSTKIDIDWSFLELIYQYTEEKKHSDVEKPILWHQDQEEVENDIRQSILNQSKQVKDDLNDSTEDKNDLNESKQVKDDLNNSREDKNDLNNSTEDKNDLNNSTEDKNDLNDSTQVKDDFNQSTEVKDDLNNSTQVKDDLNGSTQVKDDFNQSTEVKDDLNGSTQVKDDLNNSSEDKNDLNNSTQVKDDLNQSTQDENNLDNTSNKSNQVVSNQSKQDKDESNQSKQTADVSTAIYDLNTYKAILDNNKLNNKKAKVWRKRDNPLLKPGEVFVFDPVEYREAVVTPWYRNQDQPQFFLVAEICWNLSPESSFPSETHSTFRCYYRTKYGVKLTQPDQPLLDVDHTSARLNLLTPRYVNRKGVALPVSSERTRRAKRDRLDQKQILVPELCRVHPFAAPLWFATVALPCVLYRINALLIADEIRRAVGGGVGLGLSHLPPHSLHQWPPLDFGWSLAEVLNAFEKIDKRSEEMETEKRAREKEHTARHEKEKGATTKQEEEKKEKTINEILQEKEADMSFEIGTWSNDMASSIPLNEYDEYMEPLPPNLTFCTSVSGGKNWCDSIPARSSYNPSKNYEMADSDCSYISSDFDTDDTDMSGSDGETDSSRLSSENRSNAAMGVRIEYKTAHEAEAVDLEVMKSVNSSPKQDEEVDRQDVLQHLDCVISGDAPLQYKEKFHSNVERHKTEIIDKKLIDQQEPVKNILPETITSKATPIDESNQRELTKKLFPYGIEENSPVTIEDIEKNKRKLLALLQTTRPESEIKKLTCFSMVDVDIDSVDYVNEKITNVGFDSKEDYVEKVLNSKPSEYNSSYMEGHKSGKDFDFDYQPNLEGHPGPSPSIILQALTMSNANDGINLERLETIGDSFLKFAITAYLYCAHPTVHEGKLSHMRSKQVSNLNLYRLGRCRRLGARMIASKFEPHDNWLPPCHQPPDNTHMRNQDDSPLKKRTENRNEGCFIPYNLITQHSIPDKSIADCVEALIGAYLIETGPRGALLFMSYLGIKVLPLHHIELPSDHHLVTEYTAQKKMDKNPSRSSTPQSDSECESSQEDEPSEDMCIEQDTKYGVGVLEPYFKDGKWFQPVYGELKAPPSPLLRYIADPDGELDQMLSGYDALERTLQYRFNDRSLLLQALTHASHQHNRLTDCYQRLEFLGDAILDYLITRHLYEDPRRHSPGALTDLRSALVNNTIFATLAVRHQLHKYFRHMSPGLNEVLTKYVKIQEENGHSISEEHYLIQEDEMEQAEDVEVPKALGDLFESVAGAIFLDSGMSLGAVWKSYETLMGAELEAFSAAAPKSPVRELLEAEPDTAKFGKPERLADGRRVRVCVEVFGRGTFKGIGRNYRIAKGTAARCALRHLKKHRAY